MAVAAEQLTPTYQPEYPEQPPPAGYLPIDAIPFVSQTRLQARRQAYEIIENRRQLLRNGEFEAVPIPVDALGTAQRVAEVRDKYGEKSPVFADSFAGLVLDCRRLLTEAARKNTYEYFPPSRQEFDSGSQQYLSHGHSIINMTEAGLTPVAEPEELDRRINEHVEEAGHIAVGSLLGRTAVAETVRVRTISECTDWAIRAYQRQSKGGFGGYVPEIEKLMVRDVVFDPRSSVRFEEQIGLSGQYITHDVIVEALRRRDFYREALTKTELQGLQLQTPDDLFDFVKLLDTVASQFTGLDIFMGEVIQTGELNDYSQVRKVALKRQKELVGQSLQLAAYVMELQARQVDRWEAPDLVGAKAKDLLLGIAELDHTKAAEMFDEKTAAGLQEVARLRSMGQNDEAQRRLEEIQAQAPGIAYCGVDSCGLEEVEPGTEEEVEVLELGLDPSDGLIKDTVRKCKCGAKTVFYDLKGKKGCTTCKATAKYK